MKFRPIHSLHLLLAVFILFSTEASFSGNGVTRGLIIQKMVHQLLRAGGPKTLQRLRAELLSKNPPHTLDLVMEPRTSDLIRKGLEDSEFQDHLIRELEAQIKVAAPIVVNQPLPPHDVGPVFKELTGNPMTSIHRRSGSPYWLWGENPIDARQPHWGLHMVDAWDDHVQVYRSTNHGPETVYRLTANEALSPETLAVKGFFSVFKHSNQDRYFYVLAIGPRGKILEAAVYDSYSGNLKWRHKNRKKWKLESPLSEDFRLSKDGTTLLGKNLQIREHEITKPSDNPRNDINYAFSKTGVLRLSVGNDQKWRATSADGTQKEINLSGFDGYRTQVLPLTDGGWLLLERESDSGKFVRVSPKGEGYEVGRIQQADFLRFGYFLGEQAKYFFRYDEAGALEAWDPIKETWIFKLALPNSKGAGLDQVYEMACNEDTLQFWAKEYDGRFRFFELNEKELRRQGLLKEEDSQE